MLSQLYAPIEAEMQLVNQLLATTIKKSTYPTIHSIQEYILSAPGKRLRPALALLCYKLFEPDAILTIDSPVVQLAAALELIHMASLVHDDIIDEASHRHNKPSLPATWGTNVSILMGVYLYSVALELISQAALPTVLPMIGLAVQNMCEGELEQLLQRGQYEIEFDYYLDILKKKTAALFVVACEGGASMSRCTRETLPQLREFGSHLGIVFQIVDDYLDIVDSGSELGKTVGQDFALGEMTLPFMFLLQNATPNKKDEYIALFKAKTPEAFFTLQEKLRSSNSIQETKGLAYVYIDKALDIIPNLPDTPSRRSLELLVAYIEQRGFGETRTAITVAK